MFRFFLITVFLLSTFLQMIRSADIKAIRNGSKIDITVDGQLFTSYICSVEEKFPFFYPVNGPTTGGSVTSMRNSDYPHHSSLYLGCDMVNGGNYWYHGAVNGQLLASGGSNLGQIVSNGVKIVEQGDRVVITDECIWQRPGAESPLKDSRRITIKAPSATMRFIDFDITLEALTDVVILKNNHSLFAARVAADISVKNGGVMVNAEGGRGEAGTFGKPSAWIDYHGKRGNTAIEGITIMQHPSNMGFPFPWFTRDYGFFSPTPFYWPPDNTDRFHFIKGEKTTLRYRVLVHDGDHKSSDVAGQFEKYKNE